MDLRGPPAMTPLREAERTPPEGLIVYRIELHDVTLALFTYSTDQSPRAGRLTAAERDVLRAVLAGMSNAAIAAERRTSARTVANQIAGLFRKMGVTSRAQLAVRWQEGK